MTIGDDLRAARAPRASIGPEHAPALDDQLTCDPTKRALFSVDTYFRESWEDAQDTIGPSAVDVVFAHGLIMLKPDAVAKRLLEPALSWLTERCDAVVEVISCRLNRHQTRALWQHQWNIATRDRRDLADLLVSTGPVLLLFVRLPDAPIPATVRLSSWKGPADPALRQPDQLRSALGNENFLLNFVHAADEPADLVREIGIILPSDQRRLLYGMMRDDADRSAAIELECAELYREIPARRLDLTAAVENILARIDRDANDENTEALRAALNAALAGDTDDWRAICRLAERASVRLDRWDQIVIGTHLMTESDPGFEQVLRGVDVDAWNFASAQEARV